MIFATRRAVIAVAIAFGLAACGGKDAASDPLAYVPADSPYVLANQAITPKAVAEAWLKMYGVDLGEMYAEMAQDASMKEIEGEAGEWLRAALPELGKIGSVKGIEELGLQPESRFALYGYGLMPVYRIELAEPKNFAATVERIEKRAGKTLAKRKIDDAELWQFANDKVTVLFGPVGPHLILTVAPAKADDASLKAQLGLTLPESSMAKSGALQTLDQQYGFDGHMSGYIDVRSLAKRLSGRNEADNQVIAAFGGEIPKLSDSCAAELDSMTQKFPRMVFGTTRFDQKQMLANSVIEMDQELAASMQKLAAAIPGIDSTDSMMLRFAVSIDLPQTVRFLSGVSDSISAQPYQCEKLADINTRAAEMKQNLANPAMAMAGAVSALHVGIQSMTMKAGADMPESISAFATLGSSSPVMLWGFAQQGVPALAKVQLSTDGKIVALPGDAVPMPMPLQFKAIMTDKSLGLATSDLSDASLTAAAAMPANPDGTILRYSVSGAFFKLLAANLPAVDSMADEAKAKELERGRKMIGSMGEAIDRIDVRIRLTERGIEMPQESVMK